MRTAAALPRPASMRRSPKQRRRIKISPLGLVVCYFDYSNKPEFLNSLMGGTFCQHLSISFWQQHFWARGSITQVLSTPRNKRRVFTALPQALQPEPAGAEPYAVTALHKIWFTWEGTVGSHLKALSCSPSLLRLVLQLLCLFMAELLFL